MYYGFQYEGYQDYYAEDFRLVAILFVGSFFVDSFSMLDCLVGWTIIIAGLLLLCFDIDLDALSVCLRVDPRIYLEH